MSEMTIMGCDGCLKAATNRLPVYPVKIAFPDGNVDDAGFDAQIVAAGGAGGRLLIHVKDSGPGFDVEGRRAISQATMGTVAAAWR